MASSPRASPPERRGRGEEAVFSHGGVHAQQGRAFNAVQKLTCALFRCDKVELDNFTNFCLFAGASSGLCSRLFFMATIKPFAALRPDPKLADKICELPYDVISSDEARKIAAG